MDRLAPAKPNEADSFCSRWHLWLLGAILLAYVLIAWQAIHAPLVVGDDTAEMAYLRSRPSISSLLQMDCFFFFRPVKNLLFLGFDALLPLGMAASRLLAVAIGLASAAAVYALFRRLLPSALAGLSAIACWLLAPTLLSCTAWLSCVNIQVMAGFAAVAILLWLAAQEAAGRLRQRCLAGSWMATLLAVLCYEGAVCLPVVILLIDFYLYPDRLCGGRAWRTYLVPVSAVILYLLLRTVRTTAAHQIFSPNFGELADGQICAAAPWFFFQHLSIWLWPFNRQAILGGYVPGQASLLALGCAWAGGLVLAAGCLLLRRRLPFAALGVAWCLTAFLPMSNILAFRNGPYGDYYLALASMGLALAFGWGIGMLTGRGRRARGALLVLAALAVWRLAAAGESFAWARAWNDPEEIARRTLQTFPRAFSVINECARFRYRAGAYDECQALTDRALAISPRSREAHELRALVAARHGNAALAQRELDRVMEYGGADRSWSWYFQGFLLDEHRGDTNGAVRCYRQAIAKRAGWSPDVLDAMTALAYHAIHRGERGEAIALWEQVVQIDPARTRERQNLIRAYGEAGDRAKAQQHRQRLSQQP
ncbi:MAG: bacterial transcriptional activator domain-containing protein [bacterium]